MIKIDVNSDEVKRDFELRPVMIRKVSRITVNALTRDLNNDIGSTMPKVHGIGVAGYKRVRMKRTRSLIRRPAGKVWVGENKVQAKFAGRMQNVNGGAMAGKYYFKNAFVATMKKKEGTSGYTSIFKRKPGSKKLIEERITLFDAEKVVAGAVERMKPKVKPLLKENLEKEFLRTRINTKGAK